MSFADAYIQYILFLFQVFGPVIGYDLKLTAEEIEMGLIEPDSSNAQLHIVLLKVFSLSSLIFIYGSSVFFWLLCSTCIPLHKMGSDQNLWAFWVLTADFTLFGGLVSDEMLLIYCVLPSIILISQLIWDVMIG